ncbi:nucleic acid-binding protein [Mollisia scopiformis]|uniref:rRNA biogenesis protein RRP5 n=1 Tax=Mollisia scopiformis TaxID=149040 RepID=A0A194XQ73_MOLSC|nr:nucleic acid-binding protein [Mollisia scopiformis]KUJ22204.1 nucleic acid-binding protein [Mollisia scopiformis]
MAPIDKKRKTGPTNESFARSRKPVEEESRPSKRLRQEDKHESKTTTPKTTTPKTTTPKTSLVPKITKAREEDAAFPRGGASLLTPLEHKQIQIQATRDVLFEQSAKSSKTNEDGTTNGTADRKKQKSRSKGKGKKAAEEPEPEEADVKIEGLSYKRIVPGSLVLGQVSQVNDHDIALSLPNNLTGYVPITSISDKITERIEAIATKEDSEEDDEQGNSEDIELGRLFSIGQYLRAYVMSTGDDDSATPGKSKRRIELSLKPQQSNNSLSQRNVITNSTLMASVKSVEDHGLVMDLGLDDPEMKGFMGAKEIPFGAKLSDIIEGAVYLCVVTGLSSNSKIVKLSTDVRKIGDIKKQNFLSEAPAVDAFLPGTAVEVLITDVSSRGLAGKIMGMVDVTADLMHSGAAIDGKDLQARYKIGSKAKARIICTFPTSDPPKLGVSLLDHVVSLRSQLATKDGEKQHPLEILPLSTIIEEITVKKVESGVGLLVDVGLEGVSGFVHISRVKDGKIENLFESSGPYKVGSSHRGRLVGYNLLDGMYLVSMEASILEQPFLRIEDLTVAEVVKGKVEKIVVDASGVGGLLVTLAEGITGLVPKTHMSDIQLLHPEKKFKEGLAVTARVLSTDPGKRQFRLTLKKSLVNSEAAPFINYNEIAPGMQSPGTIVNILPNGAVVQFYGTIRGFLPVAEMSEAYIQDPNQHFRVGQVVNVHVLTVDAEKEKLLVSCKDASTFGAAQQAAMQKLKIGDIVSAVVTEKSSDDISVELQGLGIRAVLPVGQLTDGSSSKNASALKRIRVGQTLADLAVLEKMEQKHLVVLTNKPSLVADAKNRVLLRSFDDVKENKTVHGFVRNVTLTGVFVQFGGNLTGLLPKNKLPSDTISLPEFCLKKYQSLEAKVISVDHSQRRFLLSMVDAGRKQEPTEEQSSNTTISRPVIDPIDSTISSMEDFSLGKLTKARIASIKDTQINVQLAAGIQGRIDVSQVFDSWDQIKDRKRPLRPFSSKQIVNVRVLGIHDARNHRFLPISHRGGKNFVFELSAKPSDQSESSQGPLTLDQVKVGSSHLVFVNNITEDGLWVNLSPNVRGKIKALDVSDDVSLLGDLESNFPVGSALRVHVTNVDVANNRLDLSARSSKTSEPLTFKNLSKGMVVPGKVTRVNERQVMIQLSDRISAPVHLTDLTDDFSLADPTKYSKNDIVRVCVTEIDAPNKRITLSARPSRVLDSSLSVQDPEIISVSQLKVNDIVRGFVKNVHDKGLFVAIGANVTAYVRVSELSDSFLKDWKSEFEVDQLIKGKITKVDLENNNVQMSLKASVLDKDYVAPLAFEDMKVGQIITGKIRKVEDYGVFIVVDGSQNVSGLCHQSQMADKGVKDVRKLYDEGDVVKAKVLRINPEKRQINFGLKASYLGETGDSDSEEADDAADAMEGIRIAGSDVEDDDSDDEAGGVDLDDIESIGSAAVQNQDDSDKEMADADEENVAGLSAGGFDWSADILNQAEDQSSVASDDDEMKEQPKKKKKRKAEIQVDKTGDLDANGPQSASDFERLLLGQPDSSQLWIQYMAFQMQLSELSKAREVAERAIKIINIREETEKMNVWIALLNLENAYGSDETVEEIFKRACQYNDAQEIHERLASIYIQSGKNNKADEIFQVLVKKFSQSPTVWYNYAHFLHSTLSSPDRARALLPRATQSLPPHTHLNLTLKFAALEFHSPAGSAERGRTMFESLVSTFPKRLDIWNQLLDLEMQQGDQDVIRGVFERVVKTKGLKPKGAKAWFKRWAEWEEKNGDKKSQEKVKAKAEEWVLNAARKKGVAEDNDDD